MSDLYIYVFNTIIEYEHYTSEQKIKLLEECINNGVDINYDDSKALFQAIDQLDFDMVKFLIDNGINIKARNNKAIIYACSRCDTDIIKLLLDSGSDPNANNGKALIKCARIYNCDNIKLLISYGADPYSVSSEIFSLLSSFAENDNIISLVKYLFSIGLSCEGNMSIWNAFLVHGKNTQIKKLFFENGADPNMVGSLNKQIIKEYIPCYEKYKQRFDGACLFELAIFRNCVDDCKLLLDYGADINLHKDRIIVALENRSGMVNFFVDNGLLI